MGEWCNISNNLINRVKELEQNRLDRIYLVLLTSCAGSSSSVSTTGNCGGGCCACRIFDLVRLGGGTGGVLAAGLSLSSSTGRLGGGAVGFRIFDRVVRVS